MSPFCREGVGQGAMRTGEAPGRITLAAIAAISTLLLGVAFAAPGDIEFPVQESQVVQGIPGAVFPHWFHRIRYRCFVCHTDIFPMEVTGEGISMEDIYAGRACGTCHNGQTAFNPAYQTCNRCHVPPPD